MAEKKYTYPSGEWIKAWKEELNTNKEYAEAAKDRDDKSTLRIFPIYPNIFSHPVSEKE